MNSWFLFIVRSDVSRESMISYGDQETREDVVHGVCRNLSCMIPEGRGRCCSLWKMRDAVNLTAAKVEATGTGSVPRSVDKFCRSLENL